MQKKTQRMQIVEYMQTHDGITSLDAIREIGCTRLPARIQELRRMGYDITGKMITVRNRHGSKCSVKLYALGKEGVSDTKQIDQGEHMHER